ncbi:MAG: flagellar hook protein FlgE [Chlorobi bacterium]|nr:flagellar hook protein FlgE [Chlorobiota bacterium]
MSLINSLFSGVSGLRNHQSMMDVIGNNIANVNTIGYKGSRVTFSDTFNQFIRFGSNPTTNSGGTNTFQIGLGMKMNSVDRNWNQGTFERTGITTDLALQGSGLFVLKNNGETFYSRAGAFVFDANGNLVNPQNGAVVQGKVATADGVIPPGNNLEAIQIDTNLRLPAQATTQISWGGNLDSAASLTRSENVQLTGNLSLNLDPYDAAASPAQDASEYSVTDSSTVYDPDGNEYTLDVTYTKIADGATSDFEMTYELTDVDGNVISTQEDLTLATTAGTGPNAGANVVLMQFDNDSSDDDPTDTTTTSIGELKSIGGLDPLDSANDDTITNGMTYADTVTGLDFLVDALSVTSADNPTTFSTAVDGNREPTIINGTLTIFDSLSNGHTLTLQFTKLAENEWKWNASVPAESGSLQSNTGTISFNSDGSIAAMSPNPPTVQFSPASGAESEEIEFSFGEIGYFEGITQTASNSVISALNQNGSAAAALSNLNVDQYGYVVGIFSNGQSRQLAQVLLATFPNRNGLISVGENMFQVSANTGDVLITEPGENSGTTIQSGALEQSNVDLSEEFTKMIVAQRGFQANARVITTSDTLLQEITNLVR